MTVTLEPNSSTFTRADILDSPEIPDGRIKKFGRAVVTAAMVTVDRLNQRADGPVGRSLAQASRQSADVWATGRTGNFLSR